MIRRVTIADAERLVEIYNYYVLHSTFSFETEPLSVELMWQRIEATIAEGYPYWVYQVAGRVEGCVYLGPWKERSAYKTTAEVSIYVDRQVRGTGVGRQLLAHLLSVVDKERFHLLLACILLDNEPSVRLFEQQGFVQVSRMQQVAQKFGVWCGLGHWVFYPNRTKPQELSCSCGAHEVCRCD